MPLNACKIGSMLQMSGLPCSYMYTILSCLSMGFLPISVMHNTSKTGMRTISYA